MDLVGFEKGTWFDDIKDVQFTSISLDAEKDFDWLDVLAALLT